MRERGLKYFKRHTALPGWESLPVRERGLKYRGLMDETRLPESLPVRERGLKFISRPAPQAGRSRSLCGSVG